jgi:voltage-gated potassium channel
MASLKVSGSASSVANAAPPRAPWVERLRALYEGETHEAARFRYGLLVFDLLTIAYIVITSFMPDSMAVEVIDAGLGLVILADFVARLIIAPNWKARLHLTNLIDLIAGLSFLMPIAGEGGGFLRILRTLRLLHSGPLRARLRQDSPFFCRNEEVIIAVANMAVFIAVMTGLVYETQHWKNPQIANYADALYFTVTSLTTTGFGDITLPGTSGRMISVLIMITGVTFFLRLAQVLFRPNKVRFPCPTCGLQTHDPDAVHCKACGQTLNIPNEE